MTGRLADINSPLGMEWVLMSANAVDTNGLTCRPKHEGARGLGEPMNNGA
jgi:hypothetical protein